jgi:parallel beta-helix repeat protein
LDTSPFGNGISLVSSKNVKISGNETARNKLSGIYVADSENITIDANWTEGNDRDGISLDEQATNCKNVTLQNNFIQLNGRYGIMTKNPVGLNTHNNTLLYNKNNEY